ncbi:hypothetical protein AVEN_80574-1 [Araneus ventricosus]|uniref:Reverse transcriptase/retrotransposon-derived protein RNase H-like domain-containing protein n=1 Tax=Araneus ventricosus TaxID=182803 RepID=A0A4Y2TJL9_ARAVE|nr:hypothetical protein AVEN_80574-1 [Araneus ventricosus]
MTTARVLTYPRTDKEFILDTDASHEGAGAVLSQKIGNEECVITYFSRSLGGQMMMEDLVDGNKFSRKAEFKKFCERIMTQRKWRPLCSHEKVEQNPREILFGSTSRRRRKMVQIMPRLRSPKRTQNKN